MLAAGGRACATLTAGPGREHLGGCQGFWVCKAMQKVLHPKCLSCESTLHRAA